MSDAPATLPATVPVVAPTEASKVALALVQNASTTLGRAIDLIDTVTAQIPELQRRHRDVVYPVATAQGLRQAREARMEIRAPRYQLQNQRDAVIAVAEAVKREIKAQMDPLIEQLEDIETPVHRQITTREDEQERERNERREADERARAEIDAIRRIGTDATVLPLAELRQALEDLRARTLDPAVLGKRFEDACVARDQTFGLLSTLIAREELLQAERDQLERDRAALRDQEDASARRKAADAEAMEREKREYAADVERREAERRADEENASAERRRVEDEQAAERRRVEEEERAARLALEARQKEARVVERANVKRLNKGAPRLLKASQDLIGAAKEFALPNQLVAAVADVEIAVKLCVE